MTCGQRKVLRISNTTNISRGVMERRLQAAKLPILVHNIFLIYSQTDLLSGAVLRLSKKLRWYQAQTHLCVGNSPFRSLLFTRLCHKNYPYLFVKNLLKTRLKTPPKKLPS